MKPLIRPLVAVDDGFNLSKAYWGSGRRLRVPSRVRPGTSDAVALNGQAPTALEYRTDGLIYTAGRVDGVPTMSDDYPVSAANRIVVHHLLGACGFVGQDVDVVTSLPIRLFYQRGAANQRNMALVGGKKASLAKPVEDAKGRRVTIVEQDVMPEAVAAYFDYIVDEDPEGNPVPHFDRKDHTVGIIDIGGRTTDYAVIADRTLQLGKSTSVNLGMLNVRDYLRDHLMNTFQMEAVSDDLLDRAMSGDAVTIRRQPVDLSGPVAGFRRQLAESLKSSAMKYFGSGAELDAILLIGGGAEALREETSGWFEGQQLVDEPVFANARGMYKYQRFIA